MSKYFNILFVLVLTVFVVYAFDKNSDRFSTHFSELQKMPFEQQEKFKKAQQSTANVLIQDGCYKGEVSDFSYKSCIKNIDNGNADIIVTRDITANLLLSSEMRASGEALYKIKGNALALVDVQGDKGVFYEHGFIVDSSTDNSITINGQKHLYIHYEEENQKKKSEEEKAYIEDLKEKSFSDFSTNDFAFWFLDWIMKFGVYLAALLVVVSFFFSFRKKSGY